jgi:hypothetical protein
LIIVWPYPENNTMSERTADAPIGDIPDNRPDVVGLVPNELRFHHTARVQELLTLAVLDISRRSRDRLMSAVKNDYTFKRHDPEFFGADGLDGMNLIDLLVMVLTWKSESDLHVYDNINSAIKVNRRQYGFGDELEKIIRNTIFDIDNLEAVEVSDLGDI